jgi:hypothetical protein
VIWTYPDTSRAIAHFSAGVVEVEVAFEESGQRWHVGFKVDGAANEVAYSALEIFSGVFEAVLQFVTVREPQTIVFATDRPDLAEIYQTYLHKESKRFVASGYHVDGQHRVLRRFKPSRWSVQLQA